MKLFAKINDHSQDYESFYKDDLLHILQDGKETDYDLVALGYGRYSLIKNGKSYLVHLMRQDDTHHAHVNGNYFALEVEDERARKLKELVKSAHSGPEEFTVKAPIPGFVIKINVKEGDSVVKGDALLILEAMKMENVIKATCDCTIDKIMIKENEAVQQNQDLIKLTTT